MPNLNSSRSGFRAVSTIACVAVTVLFAEIACRPTAAQAPPKPAEGAETPKPATETPAAPENAVLPVVTTSRENISKVKGMITNGTFAPGDEVIFDSFFLKDFFPSWTLPKNRTQLRGQRDMFLKQFQSPAKPGQVRQRLNAVALKALTDLATAPKRPYDPAVRVNAMLLLGELNAAEAPLGNPNALPTPLPDAAPVMLGVLSEPNQPDAVKVAAMVGILRHLRMGGVEEAAARQQLSTLMLELLKAAAPPAGRTAEGHAWMRGQAAEILGDLGQPGANGEVPNALVAIVGDTKAPFSLRSAAARALGRLKYQAGGNLDATKWALALCQLVVDACLAEDAQPLSKRRLKERINAVDAGLNGADPQRSEPQHTGIGPLVTNKALLAAMQSAVKAIQEVLENRRLSEDKMAEMILSPRANLQNLLPKK